MKTEDVVGPMNCTTFSFITLCAFGFTRQNILSYKAFFAGKYNNDTIKMACYILKIFLSTV